MLSLNIGQWFGKLKVGQKIRLGYGMILVVTIFGTTASVSLTQYYQRQADAIEKDVLEEFKLTSRLQNSLLQTRIHTWELISLKIASKDFQDVYNHFLEHHLDFKERWLDFKESEGGTKGEEEQETPGEVEKVKEFLEKHKDVIDTYIRKIDTRSRQVNSSNLKPEDIENIKLELIQLNQSDLIAGVDSFSDNLIEIDDIIKKEYDQIHRIINTLKILQLRIIVGALRIKL